MDIETKKSTEGDAGVIDNPNTDENKKTDESKETDEAKARREKQEKWEKARAERMHEIVPGLVLGNLTSSYSRALLREYHINAVISLTDWPHVLWNTRTREEGVPRDHHKRIECADSSTQDLLVHMSDVCDFIDQMASPPLRSMDAFPASSPPDSASEPRSNSSASNSVLVHCEMGYSRSPTMIIAYLMRKCSTGREETTRFVKSRQRRIRPSPNFTRQLQVWEDVGYQLWEDAERSIPKEPYQKFLDGRAVLLKEKGLTGFESLLPKALQ